MTRRKIFAAIVAGLALFPLGVLAANWGPLSSFPRMPGSYDAKEFCSCRFVEHRTTADCEQYVAQSVVPIQSRETDESAHRVTSKALWTTTSATWLDARHGCVYDNP